VKLKLTVVAICLLLCLPAVAQSGKPKITFQCDAPYYGNLWWTVNNLRNRASDQRKFWDERFGVSEAERERLGQFAGVVNRSRRQFREWEAAREAAALERGPMVGLFMAASSSLESVTAVQVTLSEDLGDTRHRLHNLVSSNDINTIVATLAHFEPKFSEVWEQVGAREKAYAQRVQQLLNKDAPLINDFVNRIAAFYGARLDEPIEFRVHFLWSPSAQGGLSTLAERHIFCETSENEDPRRFVLSVLHEVCHYLSANTPARFKYRRSEKFLNKGVYFPLTLVEESLATALAQGCAGKKLTPDWFASNTPWVSHFGGKVDKVARRLVPIVQKMVDVHETLSESRMEEIADLCQAALSPQPKDYASNCLLVGSQPTRDLFLTRLPEAGYRPLADYSQVDALIQERDARLDRWLNRVYLVSASDMNLFSAQQWLLPVERMAFDALRSQHKQFIYTVRNGSRLEFVLYGEDNDHIKTVIDRFKTLTQIMEGLNAVPTTMEGGRGRSEVME
jgi:hypothetical protein